MIPPFLDLTPRYMDGNADPLDPAQAIINGIGSIMSMAGWTESPVGTYTSPARSDGVKIVITPSHVDGQTVGFLVKDHLGRIINNDTLTKLKIEATITMPGSGLSIYISERYLYVEVRTGAYTGCFMSGIFNKEPESLALPFPSFFVTHGPYSNAGTNYPTWVDMWTAFNGVGALPASNSVYAINWTGPFNSSVDHFSAQGSMIFAPAEFGQGSGAAYFIGRLPGILMVDSSQQVGNSFVVPLDDSHTGTFRVVTTQASNNYKLAVRID
jgi:hypothetical protein